MKTSENGLNLIKKYEGFFSKPYLDPVGIPTIGYGVIKYPNGKRVTMKDSPITEKQAVDILSKLLEETYEKEVNKHVKSNINQNQFDALVSFTYNLGGTNLGNSTLLKKLNKNPNDLSIKDEFVKWNKAGGKVLAGLTKRRKEEAELYFKPVLSDSNTEKKATTSDLNLRYGPSTDYKVIEVIKKGSEVHVLSEKDNWSEVIVCVSGNKGWVSSKYLK